MNKFLPILLLAGASLKLSAQNINAPYSVYGIGDLEQRFYDRSNGMSNASVGLMSSPYFQFLKNPASLSGLERSNVYVNLALVGKVVNYAGNAINGENKNSRDFSIKSFSVATKINNHWASSFFFMPFSYVNYNMTATKTVEGSTTTFDGQYEGDGGLYNVYWNNAVAIDKHFSVGLRASYIFGSINQTETLTSLELASAIQNKQKDYYKNFRLEYGAIYRGNLSKNLAISLGGKMAAKTKLTSERTLTIVEGSAVIKNNEVISDGNFYLPNSYSAGIALIHKNRMTFSVDYDFEQWTDLKQRGSTWSLRDSRRLSAGFQLSNIVEQWGRRFEKSYFQAGVFSNNGYLSVRNNQVNEFGASIGYGSFLSGSLFYGITLEAGRRGTVANRLIRENYVQATIALSLREFLYSKGHKYD